jgi:hypothetical protein
LKDTLVSVFQIDYTSTDKISTRMPLDINLFADLRLYNKFYVHAAYTRQITYFGNEKYNDFSFNQFYVVPKYESKKIGVYLPIEYNKFLEFQTGLAFRWKPLVIGSGNLFSYVFRSEKRANLDIYFTTRIMINRKKNRR